MSDVLLSVAPVGKGSEGREKFEDPRFQCTQAAELTIKPRQEGGSGAGEG
jgi:hypothetical protein